MGDGWKPAAGQVALIELADEADQCLTGVVMEAEGPVVVDLGSSPHPDQDRYEVTASFFAPDALYKVRATAARRAEQATLIDLTVHEIERVQRRLAERARVAIPVAMTAFDDPGDFVSVTGETVDLGSGGCRVHTTTPFPPGCDPTVSLRLPDGDTMVVLAQVLQAHDDGNGWEYRLAFMDLDENDGKRLADLARTMDTN
jgi:hypothetical protein